MYRLPDWFDWKKYENFIGNEDYGFWAYQFYSRDVGADKNSYPGAAIVKMSSEDEPRMLWSNGVLSYGMKGHATNKYIRDLSKAYTKNAKFITDEEFKVLQDEKKPVSGAVYTTMGARAEGGEAGYLMFNNKEEFEKFSIIEKALFANTIEMALNICMPKDLLLKQVSELIDHYKRKRVGEIEPVKVKGAISKRWAKGLACWDLKKSGCSIYIIAKELVPMWSKDARGRKPTDTLIENSQKNNEKTVKGVINKVDEQINGGWKLLSGDPRSSINYGDTNINK